MNDTVTQLLVICGAISTFWACFKTLKEIRKEINKPNAEQDKKIKSLEEKVDAHYKEESEQMALLKLSIASLLRDRINENYFRRALINGYMTPNDIEVVETLYDSYKALGGNGVIKHEIEAMRNLPVKQIND